MITVEWNGADSSDIDGLTLSNPTLSMVGGIRGVAVEVPGMAGGWYFPEEPGDRRLVVPAFVLSSTDFSARKTLVRQVAAWYDYRDVGILRLSEYPDVFFNARIATPPEPEEWRQLGQFDLEWVVSPYAFADTATVIALSPGASDDGSFSVDDDVFTDLVIEVTANNGTLTSFTFGIDDTVLNYLGPTITTGNSVTINGISETVTSGVNGDTMLTGAYNPGLLIMGQIAGTFPQIRPGTNVWNFESTGTATDVDVEISWRRRYL